MSLGMPKVTAFVAVPVVSDEEMDLRRHAVAICAALPRDLNDALTVLDLARGLVLDFLGAKPRP
jgi:hypothetical protein